MKLPKPIGQCFTKQYPLKGEHEEITAKLQEMVTEGIISKGRSHRFDGPMWPVLKPKMGNTD